MSVHARLQPPGQVKGIGRGHLVRHQGIGFGVVDHASAAGVTVRWAPGGAASAGVEFGMSAGAGLLSPGE